MIALFPLTTLLSAFLLFQIQPLIARVILPTFGGTPAVWTTCMLFFQALLVGGYGYGHVLATRLPPRRQALVHGVLVTLSLCVLAYAAVRWGSPLVPPPGSRPDASHSPILGILTLLFATVGVPYLVLSTTGPLVQSWSRLAYPSRSPYRLYALSNVGSLAGLLLYPTVVEPVFGVHAQAWVFATLYLAFGLSVVGCARLVAPISPAQEALAKDDSPPPTAQQYLAWMGLAAVASALLLSTTNQLCQDVAAIPLLWVVPLSIYLISFILCFDRPTWYPRWLWMPLYAGAAAFAAYLLPHTTKSLGFQIPVWSTLLLAGCMVCHGELARARPQPRHLTGFWFAVAVGGAVGGLLVSVVAPKVLHGYYEIDISVATCAVVVALALWLDRRSPLHDGNWFGTTLGLGAIAFGTAWLCLRFDKVFFNHDKLVYIGAGFIAIVISVVLSTRPGRLGARDPSYARLGVPFALVALFLSLAAHIRKQDGEIISVSRSFFGVLRVTEEDATDPARYRRLLTHGRIIHGFQLLSPAGPHTPCSYYEPDSGIGRAIRLHPHRQDGLRLGMCGLGTGTMAAYTQAGDTLRYYEIDPHVVALSQGEHPLFRYLADAYGKVDVVLGDARLSLQRELDQKGGANSGGNQFDVLAVDAFSGDAIPVHLLTREAVQLYMQHLRPDGILALHISNRHIRLYPVVRAICESLGLHMLLVDTSYDDDLIKWDSTWVLVARDEETLKPYGPPDDVPDGDDMIVKPFTDESSNVMKLLKL